LYTSNTGTYVTLAVVTSSDNFYHKKVASLRGKKPNIESCKFEQKKAK